MRRTGSPSEALDPGDRSPAAGDRKGWLRASTVALVCALAGAVLVFSQQFLTTFPAPKLFAVVALTGAASFFALGAGLEVPRRIPFGPPLLAVTAWAGLGLLRAESPEAFSLAFLPVAAAAVAAVLAAALSEKPLERTRLIAAVVLSNFACAAYASVQYFGAERAFWGSFQVLAGWAGFGEWTPWTLDYGPGRVFSTTGNPNFLAGQMALVVPIMAGLGITAPGGFRWMARAAFFFSLLALVFAQTRGAWIGVFTGTAAALAVGTFARRTFAIPVRPFLWLLIVVIGLGIAYSRPAGGLNATGISLPAQFASVADLEQQSARQRFFWWRAAFEMLSDSPVSGHGTGDFAREFPPWARRVAGPYFDLYPAFCDHPHNDYLYIACEHGIVGLGLLLWLAVAWTRTLAAAALRGSALHTGALAGVVGVAVHAVWNMPSTIHSTTFTAAVLLGITASAPAPQRGNSRAPRSAGRPTALAIAAIIVLAVSFRPAVLMTAQMYLNGARVMKQKHRFGPAAYLARKTKSLTDAPWRTSFMLGGIMYAQRMYGRSLEFFREDEIQNPWGADAILHQAKALRQLGRYEAAYAECRRALRLVPNYPEAAVTIASLAYFRAKSAHDSGQRKEMRRLLGLSRVWLTYALRFFPRNAEALKLMGFVEIMDSRWREAANAWTRYIRVKPEDAEMRQRLETLRMDTPRLLKGGKLR